MLRLTRGEVIDRLRTRLIELTGDERSVCDVAKEHGIFCRGFGRFTTQELRDEYAWLEKKARRRLTRTELEERARTWQLARQIFHDVALACDAQRRDRDQCAGWDEFSEEDLRRFHRELLGEDVDVVIAL